MPLGAGSQPTDLSEGPDCSTLDGARELAAKINAFWADRGIIANARPVLVPFSKHMREAFYVIKSDLVVRRAGLSVQERDHELR